MSDSSTTITPRLITFNCLSPYYAKEEWFRAVQLKYLSSDYRKQRLLTLLKSWFKVNFVIALQELCLEWSVDVQALCEANGYVLVYKEYSDGKMGVGIAYPCNHYVLLASEAYCAPDTIRNRINVIREKVSIENVVVQSHDAAETKAFQNVIVSLLLRVLTRGQDTGKEIIISTYHMPCRFMEEYYMVCQAREIVARQKELQTLWRGDEVSRGVYGNTVPESIPTIFMGDCNIHPKAFGYGVLTGTFNDETPSVVQEVMDAYSAVGVDFGNVVKARSAHCASTGSEPAFTNVKLKDPYDPTSIEFIECLDYILISPEVEVKSVQLGLTPKDGEDVGAYPNAICPSDHLPLSASLIIR
jgi:mRNA deadenylase 3'-5' endonuclease subunit Ccr4